MSARSRYEAHVKGWRDFVRCTINDAKFPDADDLKSYRDGIECARRAEIAEKQFAAALYGHDLSSNDERRALIQGDSWIKRGEPGREPGTVAWSEHEEAWAQYDRDGHGSQSAERINERGGFGYSEIAKLLRHPPRTWTAGRP